MDKRLFTVSEAAEYIGVTRGHLYNMLSLQIQTGSTGGLPVRPVRIPGRGQLRHGVRFDKVALDRWIDGQAERSE